MVCICDLNEEKARAAAKACGCDWTTDYRVMLKRADVDAVVVGVPNALHFSLALDSLRSGKHTAVHYPITQTHGEFRTLCDEADGRGLVVEHLLTPPREALLLKMQELAPRVGKVMTTRAVYVGGAGGTWYTDTALCGSYFLAFVSHSIIHNNILFGEPDWVDAAVHFDDSARVRSATYLARHPNGVLDHIEWHMGSPVDGGWLWVLEGQEGRLVYERHRYKERAPIRLTTPDGTVSFDLAEDRAHHLAVESLVGQALGDTREPYVSRQLTHAIVRTCAAAEASAAGQGRVRLGSQEQRLDRSFV